MSKPQRLSDLPAFAPKANHDKDGKDAGGAGGLLNTIIEIPKGHRNKYKYDEEQGLFVLHKVLPAGAVFPFDFGFIPSTRGQDGDALDVLVLMGEPAFTGCLVPARLVGALTAEQTEGKKTVRNDRLIAVAPSSAEYRDVQTLDELPGPLLDEIGHFFCSYNSYDGRSFKLLDRVGPQAAQELVRKAVK